MPGVPSVALEVRSYVSTKYIKPGLMSALYKLPQPDFSAVDGFSVRLLGWIMQASPCLLLEANNGESKGKEHGTRSRASVGIGIEPFMLGQFERGLRAHWAAGG